MTILSQPFRDESALRHDTESDIQLTYEADTPVRLAQNANS
jgi:hypothetical protein